MELMAITWLLVTSVITLLGVWLICLPSTMPEVIAQTLIYGKVGDSSKRCNILNWIQIPKKWFIHFYIFAVVQNIFATFVVFNFYCGQNPLSPIISQILDVVAPSRTPSIGSMSTILAMLLVLFQTSRRTYECLFVSVYSPASMNVLHYILGFCFYFGVTFTLLSEAPGFQSSKLQGQAQAASSGALSLYHAVGVALFAYGSYHHNQAHTIFAKLRKDMKGTVVSTQHYIPTGGLFDYVSCPHYFAEVVIYFAIAVVLEFAHTTWWLVVAWTASSQVITAILTHQWYQEKYKEYPKHRKAIIPFLL